MSDETSAPAGGEAMPAAATAPDVATVTDTGGDISLRQAAQLLSQARRKPAPSETNQAARAFVAAEPSEQPELAQADADPPSEAPSEAPDEAEPAEQPPIDPPRSWTKAEKERFQALPRETQEYLHTREQERDRDVRRSQNEVAEERKAVKAEREAAEKAKQQYEAQLPSVLQALQDAQQSSFADIRSMEDVDRMQENDPFRFQKWQVQQMKLQAASVEAERVRAEKSQAEQSQWANHVQTENALAAEYIPELADKTKGPALTQRAADRLHELGFKPDELAALASGQTRLSLYDHRIQRLIFSDLKLSDIQSAKKAVATQALPPVQRPGTSKPQGSGPSSTIQALEDKFNRTGALKDAQALHAAQAKHARRG